MFTRLIKMLNAIKNLHSNHEFFERELRSLKDIRANARLEELEKYVGKPSPRHRELTYLWQGAEFKNDHNLFNLLDKYQDFCGLEIEDVPETSPTIKIKKNAKKS